MASRALASFSWQDTVNLWLSKKFHAQRLKATALGILWHHCLEALIETLFEGIMIFVFIIIVMLIIFFS